MTVDDIASLHTEITTRREAALKTFWSDHPLNLTYRQEAGQTFSLKSYIAFVIDLPREQFQSCMGRAETPEQITDRLLRDFFKA